VDTIRSRSQHFHFRALTFAEITARLQEIARQEELKVDAGALAVIARMAEGSMRDALSLLEQARAYCGETIGSNEVRELLGVVPDDALAELVNAIAEGSAERALGLIHTFQKEGRNLQHFCREAIRHMRNLLIAKVCGADSELIAATNDQRPALGEAAARFSEEDLTRFFQILLQTDDDLRRKPDARVHLEMGLLRLINAARLAPLEELLTEIKTGTGGGPQQNPVPARRAANASAGASPVNNYSVASASAGGAQAKMVETPTFAPPKAAEIRAETAPSASMPRVASAAAAPAPVMVKDAANGAANIGDRTGSSVAAEENTESKVAGSLRCEGITEKQVAEIKSAVQQQQKFLGELLEHAGAWELAGAELRIFFPAEKKTFAEMLEGRESLERVRSISSNVLGRAIRVCAKLEVSSNPAATVRAGSDAQELRAKFERDPMVRSLLQRFGGKISEVRRAQEE
jgi:DNA polymerase-3 subunit gamma/tau